jgi:hypothetical protein
MITSHKCDNKSYQADYLEDLVWGQLKQLLTRPETIVAELERRKHETNQVDFTKELSTIEKRLADLDRQQEELLGWALKGFSEEIVVKENRKINQYRDNLKDRQSELLARIAKYKQNEFDLAGVKSFCELASANINNFTYADKRLALEALRIEVCIDGKEISITGSVPVCETVSILREPGQQV